ncbi:hypothetical protein NUW58_g1180 [Xylaria curta]|uniref:Uncharacterized protein n=1 Tax=Xylaria curta TaxID=42375 RepID=A0ACC1PP40_9PEZI|nr:hypothetical protein NUW58_g1180 [Xylaria curta]
MDSGRLVSFGRLVIDAGGSAKRPLSNVPLQAGTIILAGFGEATMSHYGGRHEWDITTAQADEAAYWFNLCSIEYGIALFFAKIAVLQLYRRVFSPHRHSAFDNGIIIMAVAIFLFHVAAPAFSLYGFIIRLRGTNNPDKNWNQPAIVMWGLLEIATAVLCASFPELGPNLLKAFGGRGAGTYFELDTYGAHATAQNHGHVVGDAQHPGEITVTKEIRVASNTTEVEQPRSPSRV